MAPLGKALAFGWKDDGSDSRETASTRPKCKMMILRRPAFREVNRVRRCAFWAWRSESLLEVLNITVPLGFALEMSAPAVFVMWVK